MPQEPSSPVPPAPPAPRSRECLAVEAISKRFGFTRALEGVSVAFASGEVHALMGENGAGKSTLGKVIAGLCRQDSGQVRLSGRALPPGDIDAAFHAGIRIVHQELSQCPHLTVAENLCLHDLPRRMPGVIDRPAMRRRARALLAGIEPGIEPNARLGDLSPGHRQIVQIAAALDDRSAAGSPRHARVIIFDEPTSSLSIAEAERLLRIVRQLAADGLTVIYVSHRMSEIFACCDRVTVLRDGQFVATSSVREIDEPTLVEQMIGRRLAPAARRGDAEARAIAGQAGGPVSPLPQVALEVQDLLSPGRVRGISFSVHAGEILGIGGLVGSGRSEMLDAMFGIDRAARGRVRVGGKPIALNPRSAIRAGIGYIPEDRRLQGLFFQLGVAENIILPEMPRLARAGVRDLHAERRITARRLNDFRIKAASPAASPAALSGGNQQKLLLARWMGSGARILLLDEPTRGVDVGTKAEVYRLIHDAADGGAAVVLVSSEMPELLALSTRLLVLCAGRIAGELAGSEMTQAAILRLATRSETTSAA